MLSAEGRLVGSWQLAVKTLKKVLRKIVLRKIVLSAERRKNSWQLAIGSQQ